MPVNRRLAAEIREGGRWNIVAGLCDRAGRGCGRWTNKTNKKKERRGEHGDVQYLGSGVCSYAVDRFLLCLNQTWMAVCVIGVVGPVYVWPNKTGHKRGGGYDIRNWPRPAPAASCDINRQAATICVNTAPNCVGGRVIEAETLHPEK